MNSLLDKSGLQDLLATHHQMHLLRFWDELDEAQKVHLAKQIVAIDFEQIAELERGGGTGRNWSALAARADLPPAIGLDTYFAEPEYCLAAAAGGNAIAAGHVAMILTAGGQGSRLGFEHPKGLFPIGPISNRSLYQVILEQALARARQFNSRIPLYVMTSPPTHEESLRFLSGNGYFGYNPEDVHLFCQGTMPAVDSQGKLLLEDKNSIFLSPDGHGGTLAALDKSGCLAEMQARGIRHVFYAQVDNPLVQACDPALVGNHILRKSEMTTQVIRKTDPLQKVGNVVSVDGTVQIIEYSDLPDEVACQTNADGSLRLWAGSIAVHVFELEFLMRANRSSDALPFHQALKKVHCLDALGNKVEPQSPNATKFEKFIFDLLPIANSAIVCEVDPAKGFCAVKNAPPANSETPAHVKAAISALHRSWLAECGVVVADGVLVEINPLFALDACELAAKIGNLKLVDRDTYFE